MKFIKAIEGFDGYFITKDGEVFCNLGKGCTDRNKRVEPYNEILIRGDLSENNE